MANVKSINGNPIVVDAEGIADGSVTTKKVAAGLSGTTRNINAAPIGRYAADSDNGIISARANNSYLGMSDKVPCEPDTVYTASIPSTIAAYSIFALFYAAEGAYLSYVNRYMSLNSGFSFKTPSDAAYVYIFVYRADDIPLDSSSYIQIEKGAVVHKYVSSQTLIDYDARDKIEPIASAFYSEINLTENAGYFGANGDISAQGAETLEVYTDKLYVLTYSRLEWSIEYDQSHVMWAAYVTYDTDGNFLERVTISSVETASNGGVIEIPQNVKYIAFTYRTYGNATFNLVGVPDIPSVLDDFGGIPEAVESAKSSAASAMSGILPLRFKPCYDHLFVSNSVITIPHESIYHVRLSRKLGFNVIEANVYKTSDGVYIVNHLVNGKFGHYFHHVDETTDISNTYLSSVTWDWVVQNVRYNSIIPKYRTRPCRLEEFLSECKQQNIIPFVTATDADAISIVEGYMGRNNYIAYGANRSTCPEAIIYHWESKPNKDEILAYCESIGRPFIYGMANTSAFSDSELRDIVDTLHKNGYWIGTSYADARWYKLVSMGFDVNGAQDLANRVEVGNVCNLNSTSGFSKYVVSNATESDGVLTFTSDGSIAPDIEAQQNGTYVVDIEISFVGTITVPSIGERPSGTYESDGSVPFFESVPVIEKSPVATISVAEGTVVTDMSYKILSV